MSGKIRTKISIEIIVISGFLLLAAASVLFYKQLSVEPPPEEKVDIFSQGPLDLISYNDGFDSGTLNEGMWTVVKSHNSSYGLVSGKLDIIPGVLPNDFFRLEVKKGSMMDFNISSDFDISRFSGGRVVFGVFDSTSDPQNGFSIDISSDKINSKIFAKTLLNGEVNIVGGKDIASSRAVNLKIARRGKVVTFWVDLDSLGATDEMVYDKGVKSVVAVSQNSGVNADPHLILDNFYVEEK